MDVGIFSRLCTRPGTSDAEAIQEHLALARATEELGFDAFWQGQEQFEPDMFLGSSPISIGSAIASTTTTLQIGLSVLQLATFHPLRAAQDVATLDQVSGGRLVVGVGRGGYDYFMKPYKIPYRETTGRNREAIEIMKKAWTQERFSHRGEFWSFDELSVGPKPYQKPHPPLAMAAFNPDTFRHAGANGYIVFVTAQGFSADYNRPLIENYRTAWREAGHNGNGKAMALTNVYVAETADLAHSEPEANVIRYNRWRTKWAATPLEGLSDEANRAREERAQLMAHASYDELVQNEFLYGTPERVADRLQGIQEDLRVDGFIMDMNCAGLLPAERVLNSARLFSDRVMPKLR